MKRTVVVERQGSTVACSYAPWHRFFWLACYDGTVWLLGAKLRKSTMKKPVKYYVDLEATNLRRIKTMKLRPFNSNKTQIGVLSAWGITLFSVIALKVLDFTMAEIMPVLECVTAIICVHILGYSITDAMVHFGKGKAK